MKHLIDSQDLDPELIGSLFSRADELEKKPENTLEGKIMASLFYEPSTRTRFSFESAMLRLGGSVITTENAKEFSSAAKGETIEDTIKVINFYSDVIVLRHYEEGTAAKAAAVSDIPVVNAGDGPGQHPTQALLDLYTVQKEHGQVDGVSIAMVGDLKHGRTIRSLSYLLGKYTDVTIYFVAPKALEVGQDIKDYLDKHNVTYHETDDLSSVVGIVDVIYQTRIQKERFATEEEYKKYKGYYQIDLEMTGKMKPNAIIMHPLPRVDEILTEVDSSPKAVYFKQAKYGVLVRMALLEHLLR
ncbi:MAG: aspartate carbamoyltransferase [Candidatus Saccharibacteria bacterium]|nr:aspartate carbamoyltransferase [Candidatus Saccharibacteria bacterium]